VAGKNIKHYIPSESQFRDLYLSMYSEISHSLREAGATDKQISEIMVEAMIRVIKSIHLKFEGLPIDFKQNFRDQISEVRKESWESAPIDKHGKDAGLLAEFVASISPIDSEILTNTYYHHLSDQETMKRMKMTEIRVIRDRKLSALNKLLGLLNASPQLQSKLKQSV
jgi:DNA-directed RNA polymerase specialized sigma subunit